MPASTDSPSPVILLDDGEIGGVRDLLEQIGVEFREVASLAEVNETDDCRLLVSSAAGALSTPSGQGRPPCVMHVVVTDSMTPELRRFLDSTECDVVIGRPIHPAVLRLLVAHALYSGPERRSLDRVAMTVPVRLEVAGELGDATLVQLSVRGCGLVAYTQVAEGQAIRVVLPAAVVGGEEVSIEGRTVAVGALGTGSGAGWEVAVKFRSLHAAARAALSRVMERHAIGTTTQTPRRESERPAPGSLDEQRSGPRKLFTRRVRVAGTERGRVLIGRDLSSGGMRVRPSPGLRVGDELSLALYGAAGEAALLIRAVVDRDDGWEGLVLRFQDVDEALGADLDRIIESLPAVRESAGAGKRQPGLVVSEIVERG